MRKLRDKERMREKGEFEFWFEKWDSWVYVGFVGLVLVQNLT